MDAIPSLQKRKIFTLLSHYTIEQLFNLNAEQLAKHKLKPEQINAFLDPNSTHIEHCLEWQESSADNHIISYGDPRYPTLLKQITSPPLLLFAQGDLSLT